MTLDVCKLFWYRHLFGGFNVTQVTPEAQTQYS